MSGSEIDIVQESLTDPITQENGTRLYRTGRQRQIVSYMGFDEGSKKKEMRQSDVSAK